VSNKVWACRDGDRIAGKKSRNEAQWIEVFGVLLWYTCIGLYIMSNWTGTWMGFGGPVAETAERQFLFCSKRIYDTRKLICGRTNDKVILKKNQDCSNVEGVLYKVWPPDTSRFTLSRSLVHRWFASCSGNISSLVSPVSSIST